MNHYQRKIIELVQKDLLRVAALECVAKLNLPQCYIAAGFVRNLVWDYLHELSQPTELNDVDVVYFDKNEASSDQFMHYQQRLKAQIPELNWQVRNQALMHERNHDNPYNSTIDAMSYWPEKETAIGIRQVDSGQFECIAVFGFESLFDGLVSFNPKRDFHSFKQRIHTKGWLQHWPFLQVVASNS